MADGAYNSTPPLNLSYMALEYMLAVTMEEPSAKSAALAQYCGGAIPEEMFLHFAYDTNVSLHMHREMVDEPVVTKTVRGWCPLHCGHYTVCPQCNESAARGRVSTAKQMKDARVPLYYWGPPVDDYAMNPAHPVYPLSTIYTIWQMRVHT